MYNRLASPRPLAVLATAAVAIALGTAARADLIFFKDGFVIEGKTVREGTRQIQNNEMIWIPKGFFYVDDIARRTYICPRQIQEPTTKEFRIEGESFGTPVPIYPPSAKAIPPFAEILEASPWDDKWERTVTLRTAPEKGMPADKIKIVQKLRSLTTHYAWADSKSNSRYVWPVAYLTREWEPDVVRKLLHSHPSLKGNKGPKGEKLTEEQLAGRGLRIATFLAQVGWYDEADKELKETLAAFPGQKEKIEEKRAVIKKLGAQQTFENLRLAREVGQHRLAQKLLSELSEEGLDEKLLTEIRELRLQYETAKTNSELARRYLAELPRDVAQPEQRSLFMEAAAAIRQELSLDEFLPPLRESYKPRIGRLDAFLALAKQAEAEQKAERKPQQGPEHLLSLAVSGWLLGNGSAEEKFEAAQRLWQARQFVLTYQKNPSHPGRMKLLEEYEKGGSTSSVLPPDEMVQLISFLPPPEAEAKVSTEPVEMQVLGRHRGPSYVLQLPPEYQLGRPNGYPVLFVLHQGGERPRAMLDRCKELAAKHGYILVAPAWEKGLRGTYSYSTEEHAAVVDVLRDLRQRFAVDSDRVFLFGYGQGGNMAFDVGLSHPDLFAGVVPMSARPTQYASTYWPNAQYLPFYVIGGDRSGKLDREDTRDEFEKWMPRGYPVMYVAYQGRGAEWFGGEMPIVFDWMSRKTRANPVQEVGRTGGGLNAEFRTMRTTDNQFYWLSVDGVADRHVNEPVPNWNPRKSPATLQATISGNNHVSVHAEGMKSVKLWFGRGSSLDFDKPITFYVNLARVSKTIKPSLAFLLEDFYQRGDRQRLYLTYLEFPL
jgi:predicted esterase